MDVAELLEFPLEDLLEGDEDTLKDTLTEVFTALQQTHEDYENALQGGGAGETGELLRQNAELQTEVDELRQELDDLKSSGSGNEQQLDALQEENVRLRSEALIKEQNIVRMKQELEQAESRVSSLSTQLHTEQEKARKKIKEASRSGKGEREKSRELAAQYEENRQLRNDIEDLTHDRETLISALEEVHGELTDAQKAKEEAQTLLNDMEKREEVQNDDHDNALQGGGALQKNLTTGLDRDQLLKLHDFVAQLKDGKDMDDIVVLDDQNMEVQLKFDEIKAKSRKIEALEQRLQQERDRTELVRTQHDETMEQLAEEQREKAEVEHWNTRLREELAKAEKTLTRRNDDIQSLKDKLDVGMEELAKVAEKLVDLEDNFNEQLESRFQAKSQQLDALKQRLREERDRTELVRSQHGDTTEQLAGANQMFSSQIELNDMLGETVRRLKVDLLRMDTTQYGDKGIKLLAPALVKMTKLKMLWLNDNNIGDDGIALLCHALPHMKALHTLGLENNKIGDGGCKSILSLFKNGSLPSLEWLYLDGNSNISSQTKSEFTREWKAKGKKGGCCLLI